MVRCSKCKFRTKYPGKKKCWDLPEPLCGACAYELDQQLFKNWEKLQKNKEYKKLFKKFIEPTLKKFNQPTKVPLYEKQYIRKPSTKGGRLNKKSNSTIVTNFSMATC